MPNVSILQLAFLCIRKDLNFEFPHRNHLFLIELLICFHSSFRNRRNRFLSNPSPSIIPRFLQFQFRSQSDTGVDITVTPIKHLIYNIFLFERWKVLEKNSRRQIIQKQRSAQDRLTKIFSTDSLRQKRSLSQQSSAEIRQLQHLKMDEWL